MQISHKILLFVIFLKLYWHIIVFARLILGLSVNDDYQKTIT